MKLEGKVAIVTGGASGLGQAAVEAYVERGAKVAVFDLNEARGNDLVTRLGADNAAFFKVNVADEQSAQAAVDGVVEKYGALHICSNFAGISSAAKTLGRDGPFPFAEFTKVINVNLVGTFNISRLAALHMANNEPVGEDGGRGVIINTASIAAFEGQIGQLAYSASKGGIVGMTLPMARDLAGIGIRVNTIAPGLILTPLFESLPEKAYQALCEAPLYPKRLGRPEEIAHLSVFIVENDYINGEVVRMDAGIRLQPR